MRLARTVFSIFSLLLPAAAGAVDLNLSAEASAGYDDNIFRSSRTETDDAVFRLSPTVGFSSEESKWGWSLAYKPTYEIFAQHTAANELTHDLRGNLDIALDDKTEIRLFERYRRLDVLNVSYDDGVDDDHDVVPEDDIRRQEMDINDGSFSLSHTLSPKWTLQTNASYRLFYSSRMNSDDSKSFSGSQSFRYAHNASNDIGFGGSVSVQMFGDVSFQPASNTFYYNVFGTWVRRFGERTTLSFRVGPALIHTDQDDTNVSIDPGSTAPRFPHVLLDQTWSLGALYEKYPSLVGRLDTTTDTVVTPPAIVPVNSVLVPSRAACGDNNYVASAARCLPRYIILDSDPDAGTIRDPANTVALTETTSRSGTSDYRFTIFGEVEITQRWLPTLVSTLTYNRSDATASAQGSGSIADTVSLLTTWRPSQLWDLSLRGTYLRRESATDISQEVLWQDLTNTELYVQIRDSDNFGYIEVDQAIDTERWSVFARVARRLTRRTTLTLRLGYVDQETRRSDRNPDTFRNFTAFVGVRYDFDPIRL